MKRYAYTLCTVVLFVSFITLTGCGEKEELAELQGRYNQLQDQHDALNEKYMKLYTDYENLKSEKESEKSAATKSKYHEPSSNVDAPFDEITMVSPTGEIIKYSTEKEKFQILEQLQIDHDNTLVQNEDGSLTISAGRPDRDELINQYWILSGWGPYNP